MGSTTANALIKRALVKARITSPHETPSATATSNAWDDLQDLMESWALEGLMVMSDVVENFTLSAGTAEYSWKTGGGFDSARPYVVKDETYVRVGVTDYRVRLMPISNYRRQRNKSDQSRPRIISALPQTDHMKIYLSPNPDSAYSLYVRSAKTLTGFSDRTTIVALETGYRRALWSNLALELCSGYGKKAPLELVAVAAESKEIVKRYNHEPVLLGTPDLSRLTGRYSGTITEGPFA